MVVNPVILTGRHVRLEPLSISHVPDLCKVGFNPAIWEWMLYGNIDDEVKMLEFVHNLLDLQEKGTDLPFAVILRGKGIAIGCTRFMEIEPFHRKLEIGGTWYGIDYQRSVVNTECKYLLLCHAFEVFNYIRVQLKTDLLNTRSQKAIERIGAVKEGILRNHMITPSGRIRDTVMYSILNREWQHVKIHLEKMLET